MLSLEDFSDNGKTKVQPLLEEVVEGVQKMGKAGNEVQAHINDDMAKPKKDNVFMYVHWSIKPVDWIC